MVVVGAAADPAPSAPSASPPSLPSAPAGSGAAAFPKFQFYHDVIEVEKKPRLTGRWRNGYPLAAEDAEFAFRISGVLEHVVVVVSRPEAVLAGDQTVLICRDTRIGIFS